MRKYGFQAHPQSHNQWLAHCSVCGGNSKFSMRYNAFMRIELTMMHDDAECLLIPAMPLITSNHNNLFDIAAPMSAVDSDMFVFAFNHCPCWLLTALVYLFHNIAISRQNSITHCFVWLRLCAADRHWLHCIELSLSMPCTEHNDDPSHLSRCHCFVVKCNISNEPEAEYMTTTRKKNIHKIYSGCVYIHRGNHNGLTSSSSLFWFFVSSLLSFNTSGCWKPSVRCHYRWILANGKSMRRNSSDSWTQFNGPTPNTQRSQFTMAPRVRQF